MDQFKTQPFEQRKSQRLSFADFAREKLFWGSLPLLGGLAALTFGILTRKHKIPPLDGSPSIVYHLYEKLINKASTRALGEKILITNEIERVPYVKLLTDDPVKQLNYVHNFWNFTKGTEIAIIPTAFHFWRHKEKNRLDLVSSVEKLKTLGDLRPSDGELRAENESLRHQLDYLEGKKNYALSGPRQHEGTIENPSREQQL